jgi:DNA-binding MarR family transcriptional regulator
LEHHLDQRLRPYGLSTTQYNVLRILRGAQRASPGAGLVQCEIRDRLVAPVPDVPRILERMERAGWIKRRRGSCDRRTTIATISQNGLEVLEAMDVLMDELVGGMFEKVPEAEVERFSELLMLARCSGKKCPESPG